MADLEKLLSEATPGPWSYHETTIHGRKFGGAWVEGRQKLDDEDRLGGDLIPISGSGGAISYTTRLVDIQCHDHNDANARLIALAPDLAAALLEAEKALAWYQEQARLCRLIHSEGDAGRAALDADGGKLAAAVLDRIRKITGGE